MAIRFDDIGNRLKALHVGSGLSAEEIARRIGISRTALFTFGSCPGLSPRRTA